MPRRTSAIAKLTVPEAREAVPRHRLFRLIDQHRGRAPHLWLSSPGGSGKTVLVSSYLREKSLPCLWFQLDAGDLDLSGFFYFLGQAVAHAAPRFRKPMPLFTAEYQGGLPVFTRRFFEELGRRLPGTGIIVFDNCESVDHNPALMEALALGIDSLPGDIAAILVSRHEAPPAFARLSMNGRLAAMGWEELKISIPEAEEIAIMHGCEPAQAGSLVERAGNWMAGLILLLEQLRRGADIAAPAHFAPQLLFNFFSQEIFAAMPEKMRDLLLKTAFLPDVSAAAATLLTGDPQAGSILEEIRSQNFFTERLTGGSDIYRYHPLFKDFLRTKARSCFSPAEITDIKCRTAFNLEQSGQGHEAVDLYLDAGNDREAVRLIPALAKGLLNQGRHLTLENWLLRLPASAVKSSPHLLYLRGACRMPFDLREARRWFEQSHAAFKDQPDATGAYLTWCGIIETYLFEWGDFKAADHWIKELPSIRATYPHFPTIDIELRVLIDHLAILMHLRPQHPDLTTETDRLETLLSQNIDSTQRLMAINNLVFYYMSLKGEMPQANQLINRLEGHREWRNSAPLSRIALEQARAACSWQNGEYHVCREAVRQGMAIAEEHGVHLWDFHLLAQGIFNAVSNGELAESHAMLERMQALIFPASRMQVCEYHYLRCLEAAHRSDLDAMETHLESALRAGRETGAVWAHTFLWLARSRICFLRGKTDEAEHCLDMAQALSDETGNRIVECGVLEDRALFAIEQGDREKTLTHLKRYLRAMRRGGYVNFPWWRDDTMASLCAKALEHNIESEYVRGLIRRRGLSPPDERSARRPLTAPLAPGPEIKTQIYVTNWPYPINLRTLGHFELLVDDRPAGQGRKAQQKTLALLKAMAAADPEGQGVTRLADLLWPESDGDKARHALEMAAHRARKLLGRDEAVQLHQGRLRLDPAICRVDAHAFAAGIDAALAALSDGRRDEAVSLLQRTLPIYRGPFLAGEDDDWVLPVREKLLLKFLAGMEKLGILYETAGDLELALTLYHRGFELAESSEEMGRQLIRCCLQSGRRSEAASAYRRLERAMQTVLGLTPAPETQKLLQP